MSTFNKVLITSIISLSSLTYAQEDFKIIDLPQNYGQRFELLGNWTIKNDKTSFVINGSQIRNITKSRSTDLALDVYFVPAATNQSIYALPNRLNKETNLGQIEGNNNSINNIRISFVSNDINKLTNGIYNAVVVIKDKKTGEAKNHKILKQNFKYENNVLSLDTPTQPTNTYLFPGEKADNKLTNIYSTVKSSVDLTYNQDQIVLDGKWNLDVDFSTFSVDISGVDNSIQNKKSTPTNKMKLLVYFTENEPKDYTTIEGYELLNVDIRSISASSQLKNTKIKTNITKNIPSGKYYPLLILTEADQDGNYKVKSVKKFYNKYKL